MPDHAALLRRAAARVRETANAANEGPWKCHDTHPRYRDRYGRLWEDRCGPLLLTPDPDEYPDWVSMLAIHHAYGPLTRVDHEEA